jgi:hypothetical protein
MDYPVLSEGQRVIVNTGRSLLPCRVDAVDGPLVYYHNDDGHSKMPGNSARIFVYAIPDESERMLQDVEAQNCSFKYQAARIAARGKA